MLPSEMSADLKSIQRKRKQGRARTARYRASPNGQAKIAAYNKRKSTKIKLRLAKRRRRLTLDYRVQELHDKAHYLARIKGEKCTVTKAGIREKLRPLVCSISGIKLELTGHPVFSRNPFSPSLDRIDRRGIHKDDNSRITCTLVNMAMNEWGLEYLEEVAFKLILKYVPPRLRNLLMAWRRSQAQFGVPDPATRWTRSKPLKDGAGTKSRCSAKISTMRCRKLSICFDPRLGSQVRAAARKARVSVSTRLAQAAAAKLRAEKLGKFLVDWEGKHGKLTGQEFARAARELAPPVKSPRK
jgi:hypothetical protein